MTSRCVLWDFGDTLADQDWLLAPPPGFPDWPVAWTEAARGELETTWYLNEVSVDDVARRVSRSLGMPWSQVMAHIRQCCDQVRFLEAPWKAARASPLPQALVTVNPDVFTRFVVPRYRLDEHFAVIVTSWEEGTVDKAELCATAVRRLGPGQRRDEALLIDNLEQNVRGWERVGGRGYVFRDEARFSADLDSELGELLGLR